MSWIACLSYTYLLSTSVQIVTCSRVPIMCQLLMQKVPDLRQKAGLRMACQLEKSQ